MNGRVLIVCCLIFICLSCSNETKVDSNTGPNFTLKENASIGIDFSNDLSYTRDFNVYKYRNFYNGGGVAIGDLDNDGFSDVYLVMNQGPNHLYRNLGDWQFEDITESSGAGGERSWSTGVSMVDINADGLLDIYVCNSGDVKGDDKENELFINNGDLTFTESAAAYGLADKGYTTHVSFFDYDKDGDLDAYILNNSFQAIGSFNLRKNERPNRDELGGDKLMRNDGGKFTDVSDEAGIYGSVIGFGLGITVGDVNNDNWEDIFISNDFFERDYLYINQQDGTFSEELTDQIQSTSGASMGADIADINGDGYNDIFVTEMLPSDYSRLKTVTTFENWDKYKLNLDFGYHHQYTRNVLHANHGNGHWSDVGRFAGVEASDWSWGALFFDMDNDGLKDLFIANGIYRDLTDQDYLNYIANESVMRSIISDEGVNYKELIDIIPSNKVPNHAFWNRGGLHFDKAEESGLWTPSFSNGSAYGDLDNDGDLDLVVNNINMQAFLYENQSPANNHFLNLTLKGKGQNTYAIGSKVLITTDSTQQMLEQQPVRGFESSMEPRLHVGLGSAQSARVEIIWPDGSYTDIGSVTADQFITAQWKEGLPKYQSKEGNQVRPWTLDTTSYVHVENMYSDFNKEKLIYHMLSNQGPDVAVGDVNGDGKQEVVIPGAMKEATQIVDLSLRQLSLADFSKQSGAEHTAVHLFDADGDGDLDCLTASGGTELSGFSDLLHDRIYLNDGSGNYTLTDQKLPNGNDRVSTGTVSVADIDGDGDLDIFLGERVKVGDYGALCNGYILKNDGSGNYTDVTKTDAPDLSNIGMITSSAFHDLTGDGLPELIVAGEFMPVSIFVNVNGVYKKKRELAQSAGWWNKIILSDIDGDGDADIICGNHGLNSRFRTSVDRPLKCFHTDFDQNGQPESILTQQQDDGRDYPVALRHILTARMPSLKKKYPDFQSFKGAAINDMFDAEILDQAEVVDVVELRSCIFRNNGSLKFSKEALPDAVQMSPIYAMTTTDVNEDGREDIILGGNLHGVAPEMGRYDASYGHVLVQQEDGAFRDMAKEYGFVVTGEIRDIEVIDKSVYVFRNGDSALVFKYSE